MTQPDGGQSPYDPPQQPELPEQNQSTPQQGSVPGEQPPYQQAPYGQAPQAPQAPYGQAPYGQEGQVYAQGGQPYAYGAPLPKNSLGVWSLVLGILAVLGCGLLTGIAAIITGHKSRNAQKEGQADNGGMGLAGIITGWVGIAWTTIYVAILIGLFAFAATDSGFQDDLQQELESGYSSDY